MAPQEQRKKPASSISGQNRNDEGRSVHPAPSQAQPPKKGEIAPDQQKKPTPSASERDRNCERPAVPPVQRQENEPTKSKKRVRKHKKKGGQTKQKKRASSGTGGADVTAEDESSWEGFSDDSGTEHPVAKRAPKLAAKGVLKAVTARPSSLGGPSQSSQRGDQQGDQGDESSDDSVLGRELVTEQEGTSQQSSTNRQAGRGVASKPRPDPIVITLSDADEEPEDDRVSDHRHDKEKATSQRPWLKRKLASSKPSQQWRRFALPGSYEETEEPPKSRTAKAREQQGSTRRSTRAKTPRSRYSPSEADPNEGRSQRSRSCPRFSDQSSRPAAVSRSKGKGKAKATEAADVSPDEEVTTETLTQMLKYHVELLQSTLPNAEAELRKYVARQVPLEQKSRQNRLNLRRQRDHVRHVKNGIRNFGLLALLLAREDVRLAIERSNEKWNVMDEDEGEPRPEVEE